MPNLWVKDESQNPTQSFKARGMAVAVSMAKHLGATKLAVPTAGNAGGALAAYAARAGLEAHIFMPRDTPRANVIECRELGAHVTLIDGLITDCGAEIARRKDGGRLVRSVDLEGALSGRGQEDARLRTGGAARLAVARRHSLSDRRRHRLDRNVESVRRDGDDGLDRREASAHVFGPGERLRADRPRLRGRARARAAEFPNAHTCASGLRVPKAIGDFLMLKILRESKGGAVAVDDDEMIRTTREVGATEGLFVAPEGAACFAALQIAFRGGKDRA